MGRFYNFADTKDLLFGKLIPMNKWNFIKKQDHLLKYTTTSHRCYKDVSDPFLSEK